MIKRTNSRQNASFLSTSLLLRSWVVWKYSNISNRCLKILSCPRIMLNRTTGHSNKLAEKSCGLVFIFLIGHEFEHPSHVYLSYIYLPFWCTSSIFLVYFCLGLLVFDAQLCRSDPYVIDIAVDGCGTGKYNLPAFGLSFLSLNDVFRETQFLNFCEVSLYFPHDFLKERQYQRMLK